MSAISATSALPAAALPTTSASLPAGNLPMIDPANEPAAVRNGDQKAKNAYETGVAFENVLVNELAQQLAATVPGLDGSDDGLGGTSDDSSDGSSAGSTGGVGGGGGLGAYSSLLPQTLASSVMSGGGTGIAMQIAQSIDPALGAPKK
jgi:Rod binding domain-containing protein